MKPAQQCAWDDVRELLPSVERSAHTIALHRALEQDERYNWTDRFGGDVLTSLVLRYGWPGYTGWGGDDIDDDHSEYLETQSSPRTSPYTTFEYSIDRVHTLPPWSVVASPFAVPEISWSMSPDDLLGHPYTEWWPVEHVRTRRRLVQLPEGQHALMRRQTGIRVASTITPDHPMLRTGAALDVMMVSSPDPSHVDSVSRRAMRARFGVVPPPTLQSMRVGEIAVSEPVLLDVQNGRINVDVPSDSLFDHMRNTVHLNSRTRRVGVYWKTYGVAATDTVTISVRMVTAVIRKSFGDRSKVFWHYVPRTETP